MAAMKPLEERESGGQPLHNIIPYALQQELAKAHSALSDGEY